MGRTGYFSHKDFWKHEMGPGHPECPARLDAIEDRLLMTGVTDGLQHMEVPLASMDDVLLAHDAAYVDSLHEMSMRLQIAPANGSLTHPNKDDPDTLMNAFTYQAALRGVGAAVAATDAVIHGTLENAFCAMRPPGHHAERARAMGFCFLNHVAIAALHALERKGLQRVAVIDFDVHHGNGTENILAGDDRVLMVSFFQHPFYPFSGDQNAAANMLNMPVPAYTKGMDIRELVEMFWIPRLESFKPELIFISAGFDAHREDDMGQLNLNEQDFIWMTERIKDVARRFAKGRIVSCLEGGYSMGALARSVEGHVRTLADI